MFERISDSRAIAVPAYNHDIISRSSGNWGELVRDYPKGRVMEIRDDKEWSYRKEKLDNELENAIVSPRRFLMIHFVKPDVHQHFYGDESIGHFNRDKLNKFYQEIDSEAEEIRKKALAAGYDYIIFMSDHGLPTETEHNEKAFYSCNRELFPDETPHITDFHDKIMELVEKS